VFPNVFQVAVRHAQFLCVGMYTALDDLIAHGGISGSVQGYQPVYNIL